MRNPFAVIGQLCGAGGSACLCFSGRNSSHDGEPATDGISARSFRGRSSDRDRGRRNRLPHILRLVLVPILVFAQQPAKPPAGPPQVQSQVQAATGPVTFSATTQLVVEEVTVKDKSGKVIPGLKKEDFTVTEDNKPQEIKFFDFENVEEVAANAPPPPPLPPAEALPKVTHTEIAPEPKGETHYKDRRLLALYFDMASMPVLDQLRALDSAQSFIKKNMNAADVMAIMKYDGQGVEVLQDFTGDREKLQTVIATLVVGEADNTGETNADAGAADTGAAFGQDDSEFNVFNTDRQLAALQTVAKTLGSLSEKKVLIYFASGMQLNGVDNQAQLRSTINDAIRSGVQFWPIDARGLTATPPLGFAAQGSQGNAGMYTGAASQAMQANFAKSQDTLYTLAADTGGKAMLDFNDLGQGIINAEKSISSYYIIGYYTTNDAPDGKFRRVKVTLNNGMQANLEFRQGYYANKVFGKFTTADKERQLEDALMAGDPVTELTIALEVNYFMINKAEYFTPIMMKIPGSELALAKKGGAEHTLIDFIGEIKDESGSTVSNIRDKLDIPLSNAVATEFVKHPIAYDAGFTLLPGEYSIKIVARDSETGRIGTFLGKFKIQNLDRVQQMVPITSVVLSSQRQAMSTALLNAQKGDKASATQAVNPLVQDGMKLIPSVTRVFSTKNDMYVYLQAYEKGATSTQPLVAYVTFYKGSTKAMETPPVKVAEGMDPKSHMLPIKLAFPLSKLKPGEYNCQVTVLDPTGQKAAFWQAPVMMIP
jgi:VWFA-related protein